MGHGLGKLGPSLFREGVVLPVEPFIPELDSAGHETPLLELLEGRVYRPSLGPPVSGEPLLQFPDHFVPVHRLFRQEQEQPKGDSSNFNATRIARRHHLTSTGAKPVRTYMHKYSNQLQPGTD